ncbi:MAG: PAS domain S-box protein [Deltaproteobacteria bacterium]|nr:PAS domain S-box protein [Deltaproteobacteria bacterium]
MSKRTFASDIPSFPQGNFPPGQQAVAERCRSTTGKEMLLHFSTALEVSADSIVIGDLEGKILYANEAAWRGYGAADGMELIGKNALDLIAPEERERAIAGMGQVLKTGRVASQEYQVLNHAGARVPVESSTALIRDDQGEAIGFVNVLRDMAERKRTEESLHQAQAELESRVRERTAELERINATLRQEIAQRQRVEEALRESEGRAHILFENASDAIALIALDGTTLNVNRGAEILLRHDRAEIIGKLYSDFVTPASLQLTAERFQRAATGERLPSIFELDLMRKDGSTVPVEARTRFLRDQHGAVTGLLGIYRDVTDRKRAEEDLRKAHDELENHVWVRTEELTVMNAALQAEVAERKYAEQLAREAEQEYRSIFENAPEGLYRSSIDGHQIRANPALVKLNGYSSEEEQIAGVNDIASEWYVDLQRRDEFKRLLAEHERVTDFESEIYRHKARDRMWISENARLVRDKKTNAPLYYEGTVRDITARKQAEEALLHAHVQLEQRVQERTAELSDTNAMLRAEIAERQRTATALERLRRQHESILNSAGEGIIGVDLEGKAVFVNLEAARLLEREVAELLGTTLHSLVHHTKLDGTPYPEEECPFRATLSQGETIHVSDEVYWRKDGTSFPVECLSTPIRDEEGEVLGAVITFRDITQRKEVDRMKDELISTVSHELRTPLASLRGFTELMLKREFPPEQQRELIGVIHKESLRLTNLINDFLDLQRIEAGRFPYTFAPLLVAPLMREVAAVFTKEGGAHALRLDLPASLPTILADGERIRQVLSNLFSNAIKFSPKGGEVIVGARQEERTVTIWVQDQGVGIPEEAIAKLSLSFIESITG